MLLMDAQRKLVPEMMELMQQRYRILKLVKMAGPIGRRPLGQDGWFIGAGNTNNDGYAKRTKSNSYCKRRASITTEGLDILLALESVDGRLVGSCFACKKADRMHWAFNQSKLFRVIADTDTASKSLLGMEAAKQFSAKIGKGKIVAVTGGSTIASIPPYIEKSTVPIICCLSLQGAVSGMILDCRRMSLRHLSLQHAGVRIVHFIIRSR